MRRFHNERKHMNILCESDYHCYMYDQDIHGRHLKTHELSLKEKEFVKVCF